MFISSAHSSIILWYIHILLYVCAIDSIMLNLELTLKLLSTCVIMFIIPKQSTTATKIVRIVNISECGNSFLDILVLSRCFITKNVWKCRCFIVKSVFVCITVHKANNNCCSHVEWIMSSWFRVTILWQHVVYTYTYTYTYIDETCNNTSLTLFLIPDIYTPMLGICVCMCGWAVKYIQFAFEKQCA